jgi:PST family polysaccharide transporter
VPEGPWARGLTGAGLFLVLFLVRERLPGPLPLVGELRHIRDIVRARLA